MNKDDLIMEDGKEYVEVSMEELFKTHLYRNGYRNGMSSHDISVVFDSIKVPISTFFYKTHGQKKASVLPGNKTIH